MDFAVVDVEASGGIKENNRIIEIGVVLTDGKEIFETFHSLVYPGVEVSPFVEHLTGITTEMLANEPPFARIAEKVFSMLDGKIFVAHNVSFDYSLLRNELRRTANKLELPRLCTVKLSRRIFPGLASYKLDSVTNSLGIAPFTHHRALDDALAAAEILKCAIEKAGEEAVWQNVSHKGSLLKKT